MDPVADELSRVGPDLFLWQAYDPKVKADLFSTALLTPAGLLIVDPISLAGAAINELQQIAAVVGIIVTNSNHARASLEFAKRFSAPLFARRESLKGKKVPFTEVRNGDGICAAVDVIAIDGAAPGEIALHYASNNGTLIVGDALINFEPHGFSLLPKKYCSDEKEMRRSLGKLLAAKSVRMLFAHGTPILSGATARLHRLLDVDLRGNPS
jgi:metallo-beta-lactamase superfamily protein